MIVACDEYHIRGAYNAYIMRTITGGGANDAEE